MEIEVIHGQIIAKANHYQAPVYRLWDSKKPLFRGLRGRGFLSLWELSIYFDIDILSTMRTKYFIIQVHNLRNSKIV